MNSEELKRQLAQAGQEKQSHAELMVSMALGSVKTLKNELEESGKQLREDMRTDGRTNREELAALLTHEREESRKEREEWRKERALLHSQSQEALAQARQEAEKLKKAIWTRTIPTTVAVMLAVCVGAAVLQWTLITKGTSSAFADLNANEAKALAEQRSQVQAAKQELATARQELATVKQEVQTQKAALSRLDVRWIEDRAYAVVQEAQPLVYTDKTDGAKVVEISLRKEK